MDSRSSAEPRRAKKSAAGGALNPLLSFPFSEIQPRPGAILVTGPSGGGKTTCCLKAARQASHLILVNDQSVRSTAVAWYRVNGRSSSPPRIAVFETWRDVRAAVRGLKKGQVLIVDSVNLIPGRDQSRAIAREVEEAGACILLVSQEGRACKASSSSSLIAAVTISRSSEGGLHKMSFEKSRGGEAREILFRLGGRGPELVEKES